AEIGDVFRALHGQDLAPPPQATRPASRDRPVGERLSRSIQVIAGEQRALVGRVDTDQAPRIIPGTRKATFEVAEGRPGSFAQAKRWTNARAVSATSLHPLSMVSEWPRPGIWVISVTPGLRFWRL